MRAIVWSLGTTLLVSWTAIADTPDSRTPMSVGEVRGDSVRDLIVGKWAPDQNMAPGAVVEFKKNGKFAISAQQFNMEGTYKFLKNDQIELKLSMQGNDSTVELHIKLTKDSMTATPEGQTKAEKFKRIK